MKHFIYCILFASSILLSQTGDIIKKAAKAAGLTETQARSMARERGMSDADVKAEAQKRGYIPAENPPSSSPTIIDPVDSSTPVENVIELTEGDVSPLETIDESEPGVEEETTEIESEIQPGKRPLPYFGYEIFKGDPAAFQASTFGAIDPNYNIGPGDEIIIMLWGETQFRQKFNVDREGYIFIPDIGQVFVNSLTLEKLEKKLFKLLSKAYSSLKSSSGRATTFLDISLGELRPLRIMVLGDVAQPGAYAVSPTTTLFTSLYYFRGPTTNGSLRDIQLIRKGKKIGSIDFYNYLLTGKTIGDERLQLDDVIFIPKRGKTVSVKGEVNRNAIFELKENEKFNQLLVMAGGLNNTAYLDRAQIDRIVPFDERTDYWNDRVLEDFNLGMIHTDDRPLKLRDGDAVQIFSILEMHRNDVYINGPAVSRPGRFELVLGMRVADLIQEAGGLLSDVYLEKAHIIRTKQDDLREELISIHLNKALDGDPSHNVELQWMDKIRIFSLSEMIPDYSVSLTGHVKAPGTYKLLHNMTLYDLLFERGGFLDKEFKKRTYLERAELVRITDDGDEKEIITFNLESVLMGRGKSNTPLKVYDAIRIYSLEEIEGASQFVSISGHVKRPGRYELFENNMTAYDILFKTGGFDDPLYLSQTFLKRADLIRFDADRITQSIFPFHLESVISNKKSKENFSLLPGDEIRIYAESVFNAVKSVSINGVVKNPGAFTLKTGMTLKDLILEAGGLNSDVYRYKIDLARIDPTNEKLNEYAEIVTFNMDNKFTVSDVLADKSPTSNSADQIEGFLLNPYDLISIRPDPYFSKQRNVIVSGMVIYPGAYTILSYDETISDIIKRAGGPKPDAYLEASQFKRLGQTIKISLKDVVENKKSKSNFNVQGGDEIIIVPKPNMVVIQGEVNNPGIRKYISGKNVKYYISKSGGINLEADRDNIWVQYPNGDSKKWRKYSLMSPKVLDGSIIIIKTKPEEEPFDKTEFSKEMASIFADFAQVVALFLVAR